LVHASSFKRGLTSAYSAATGRIMRYGTSRIMR
jgi:hypothetical protein